VTDDCPCEEDGEMANPDTCSQCPIDLPSNVAASLQQQLVASHQQAMETIGQVRNLSAQNAEFAANAARLSAVRKMDELDAVESRATSGVLGTPIAGPTTAQPAG